jgi:glycosyltransferase involved in cell wall biosynthesis
MINEIVEKLVSIIAISYNQEEYIIATLNSILSQTYINIQLIICDDGSTDSTKILIEDWIKCKCPNAIFINHPYNIGITKNLNSALPFIKGEYYQFVGCEDEMLPHKIESQVKILENNKDISIVYSDMYRMNKNGIIEPQTHFEKNNYNIPRSGWIYKYLLERCFVSTPTALMRTRVLFAIGGDNEKLGVNDYDFWIRASKNFKFYYQKDITMKYRVLYTSVSNRNGIFMYVNNFLTFAMNYDNRLEYKYKFNHRLLFNVKNLYYLKFKYTSLFAFKAFKHSRNLLFIKYAIASLPLYFIGKEK